MDSIEQIRALSHDEKNAAEAAFAGRPMNPKWTVRARTVYAGIINALPTPPAVPVELSTRTEGTDTPISSTAAGLTTQQAELAEQQPAEEADPTKKELTKIPFEQALASGALIDVTPTAKDLGFSFPITVTKPLWEMGIAPSQITTKEEQSRRLRDVLMAFRLRLAGQATISPLIDFPALLTLPPNSVPQPIPLFALIQPDEENRAMVTLLLPNEVAASIIPMN
jgi:Family of unknown function (DUF6573)